MLRKFAQRHFVPTSQRYQRAFAAPRFFSTEPCMDDDDDDTTENGLLDLHFTQEDDGVKRPFRFVGIRDVEIEDKRYEDRDQTVKPKNAPIVLRNSYGYPNFVSLYVDTLPKCVEYMKQNNIPHDPPRKNEEGVDVVTIPPTPESAPHFDLCDKPAFVELLQASPDLIKEFEDNERENSKTSFDD
ncbi:hypothetical protein H310_14891 [Aphanomyces invadans]|uniref:Uncharacterized protein n=1 Tax=Aphanomyces invadans TaxID=157072 RepID=A0A024TAC2_9STRA|nr:hypothetical protein H310_14891 [Aphanomyces invadans]ETV90292.1 hypothetical protein H310_14891 [Aphanomyces invadans]|eukprot:XP_008881077.1 hypothetical protein H310_14891 [Aphanomyces invadans]